METNAMQQTVIDAKHAHRRKQEAVSLAKKRVANIMQLSEKVLAHSAGVSIATSTYEAIEHRLQQDGFFYNPIERQVQSEFLHWLYSEADGSVNKIRKCEDILDETIRLVLQRCRNIDFQNDGYIRIFVKGKGLGVDVIGPIPVSPDEPLCTVEEKIDEWMKNTVGSSAQAPPGGYLSLVDNTN